MKKQGSYIITKPVGLKPNEEMWTHKYSGKRYIVCSDGELPSLTAMEASKVFCKDNGLIEHLNDKDK